MEQVQVEKRVIPLRQYEGMTVVQQGFCPKDTKFPEYVRRVAKCINHCSHYSIEENGIGYCSCEQSLTELFGEA